MRTPLIYLIPSVLMAWVLSVVVSLIISFQLVSSSFAWEFHGVGVPIVAAVLALFVAAAGAVVSLLLAKRGWSESSRLGLPALGGALAGLVCGLWVCNKTGVYASNAPDGIVFWTLVILTLAGAIAGAIGSGVPLESLRQGSDTGS